MKEVINMLEEMAGVKAMNKTAGGIEYNRQLHLARVLKRNPKNKQRSHMKIKPGSVEKA